MRNKIRIVFIPLLLILFFSSCNYCGFFGGAHDLGNKLTLFERDNQEGHNDIIYCSNYKDGCCFGGMYVIPSEGNQYYMYVDKAKSNDNWVIAKSIQEKDKKENYWIISKEFDIENLNCDEVNCDSIIQSHVMGPLEIESFNEKLSELEIDLEF